MASPGRWPTRRPSHPSSHIPSYSYFDDAPYVPVPTRSGALASLIRSRSASSAHRRPLPSTPPPQDEEAALGDAAAAAAAGGDEDDIARLLSNERRLSQILHGPRARSMGLIGRSNPRYKWEQYWKRKHELKSMTAPMRRYYERTNDLVQQYMYIDRLLDSSIPHDLLNEYSVELEASAYRPIDVPATIPEAESPSLLDSRPSSPPSHGSGSGSSPVRASYGTMNSPSTPATSAASPTVNKAPFTSNGTSTSSQKRTTPKDIFRSSESMPLLKGHGDDDDDDDPAAASTADAAAATADEDDGGDKDGPRPQLPWLEEADVDHDSPVVTWAIWINFIANTILFVGKIFVVLSVPSVSVLASLVDAALDFLSTIIVWLTTRLISSSQHDQNNYPVGRRRLEPVGILVFSIIMMTSFVQVALESIQRLTGTEHALIRLSTPALVTMVGTIVIKGACWLWCRLVRNSSVRALAEDAKTDIVFNTGSILFPIIGYYARVWWLDATGGLLLSIFVVVQWSQTSAHHVRNLTGLSASPDERNLLLYLTMRFATAIRQIQNLRAYHAGDKLIVEVDIVLSANTPLKDSHDLSEVLTYFLEAVPIVDRAFVHVDYTSYNAPTHMLKQTSST